MRCIIIDVLGVMYVVVTSSIGPSLASMTSRNSNPNKGMAPL